MIQQTDLDRYASKIKADYAAFTKGGNRDIVVEFEWGSKFIKVTSATYGQKSVHSFIAKGSNPKDKWPEGTILKAASWRAPAQNFARGNIYDTVLQRVRWTGVM